MFVPSDSFGGMSSERKAANALRTMFTFVACKVILAQLEGSGRGSLAAYNADAYGTLMRHLSSQPMRDGDEWLAALMRDDRMLALRVMEVRDAYCEEDFEWEMCRKLAVKDMKDANVALMRQAVTTSFHAEMASESANPSTDTGC